MAYHFNNKIEIIEETEDPNAFYARRGYDYKSCSISWADVRTMKGRELQMQVLL